MLASVLKIISKASAMSCIHSYSLLILALYHCQEIFYSGHASFELVLIFCYYLSHLYGS